jgi:hypothetical protein
MSDEITLENVERLAMKLAPQDRMKLVTRIREQLSAAAIVDAKPEHVGVDSVTKEDAWLADCDAVAEAVEGEFDSAADLRAIREERASRL